MSAAQSHSVRVSAFDRTPHCCHLEGSTFAEDGEEANITSLSAEAIQGAPEQVKSRLR